MVNLTNQSNSFHIDCLNRNYIYIDSVFPCSLNISGKEFLYAPISLCAEFGNGVVSWKNVYKRVFENKEDSKTFVMSMEAENLILNASITAEEDGFIKTDFSLVPYWHAAKDNVPKLTKLYIDIPIKSEFAPFYHFFPGGDSVVSLSPDILTSGAIPANGMKLPFKPYIWIGWDNGGLGICCESDENFEVRDSCSIYSIEPRDGYVNLRINLLDSMPSVWQGGRPEQWEDNLPVISYTFGIQATPVKELTQQHLIDWRVYHTAFSDFMTEYNADSIGFLRRLSQSGATWIILHEDWSVFQNYGEPEDRKQFIRLVQELHSNSLKVAVYFGYELSSMLPQFHSNRDKLLVKNVNGNTTGGWQRKPAQRDFIVCHAGSYGDVMTERVKYVMDELGVDGIYTDGMHEPFECANEAHGCGYRDKDGILHATYPIFSVREHAKKFYRVIHDRNGRLDTHQSSCCVVPTLSYCDSFYDGENIQLLLAKGLKNLKLDAFRAEYSGTAMGLPGNFIAMPDNGYTMRMIAGITLLHNVYPRPSDMESLEFMSEIWKAFDDFGVSDAQWCPYWKNQIFFIDDDDILCSYYQKGDDYLLIVNSFADEPRQLKLPFACEKITDYLDETAKCDKGCIEISVEPMNLKLCKFIGVK